MATLKRLGFQNVHVEPFTTPAWSRGAESGAVVGPVPYPLHLLGLGNSTLTPADYLLGKLGTIAGVMVILWTGPLVFGWLLSLLLASDRRFGSGVRLEPDQAIDAVLSGEARHGFALVLPNALREIGGHADVERVGVVADDVDVILH